MAFCREARERLGADLVHESFLGPIPKYAHLPLSGLLVAMLAGRQIPKLSACFGIRDGSAGIFQGAPAAVGQCLCLAQKDFLGHLRNRLIGSHDATLLSRASLTRRLLVNQ